MKILICDYEEELKRDIDYEKRLLKDGLGESVDIEVLPYESEEQLKAHIEDAHMLLTAFIPVTKAVLAAAKNLKCISVNATGYGTIDVEEARKREIAVCPVFEYCTNEVAEHTMALMLSLNRNIKGYLQTVEENHLWNYAATGVERIAGQTLAIFGFGRIGRAVAKRAKAFEMQVLAVDPYLSEEEASGLGVCAVTKEEAFERADMITNHMNQTKENEQYFNEAAFRSMKKRPLFFNVGRGSTVDEAALVKALEENWIRGAALDVLESEEPDLKHSPLLSRENVMVTPHCAFYSRTSMRELQRISCENMIHYWKGEFQDITCV